MTVVPLIIVVFAAFFLVHAVRKRARTKEEVVLAAVAAGALSAWLSISMSLELVAFGPGILAVCVLLGALAGRVRERDAEGPLVEVSRAETILS